MENILHDFNEKVINLVTNYLKNSISDGGLSSFTDDLVKEFADLGTKTANFLINYAEETIFKLKERKEQFESLEKDDRTIITIFGEIKFKRRYYQDKETEERIYLLDQFLQLKPSQKNVNECTRKINKRSNKT